MAIPAMAGPNTSQLALSFHRYSATTAWHTNELNIVEVDIPRPVFRALQYLQDRSKAQREHINGACTSPNTRDVILDGQDVEQHVDEGHNHRQCQDPGVVVLELRSWSGASEVSWGNQCKHTVQRLAPCVPLHRSPLSPAERAQ